MKRKLAILLACVLTVQGIVPAAAEETAADAEAAGAVAMELAEETAAETEDAAEELLAGKLVDEAGQDVPVYEEPDAETVQNEIAAPETDAAVMTEAAADAATGAAQETAVKPVNESDAEQTGEQEQEAETSADGAGELIIEPDYADVELAETALPETSVIAAGDVPIDAAHFPDEKFREYVKRYDKDQNMILSEDEISSVHIIALGDDGITDISDLSGIEYFTQLWDLWCANNKLTSLDVSKNTSLNLLACGGNDIKSLDVSKNPNLWRLYCEKCNLTELDVSKNTKLDTIFCDHNHLTSLDVSKNTILTTLGCRDNNLTYLDLRKNTELSWLYCEDNNLTSLDLSKEIDWLAWSVSGNVSSAILKPIQGGWQLDLEKVVGTGKAGKVKITSEIAGMKREGNIVSFMGNAPETLNYIYDVGYKGMEESGLYFEVILNLKKPCTVHKFGDYVVTRQATALKKGTAVRTCTVCGEQQSKSVPKLKPTIKLSTSSVTLDVKKSVKVKVSALASGDAVASWKSSDTSIATVNKKGKITAKSKAGKATVTVTLKSGLSKKISVTVQKGAVACTSVTLNKKSLTLKKGKTFTLKATVKPASCTQKAAYKTSSKSVATVNSKGKITAKKKGTATITVTVGKKTATCKVKVVK